MTVFRKCPDCGGPVPVDENNKWLVCSQCGRDWFPYQAKQIDMPRAWTESEIRKLIIEVLEKALGEKRE